jgi:hypothetical protein
MSSYIGRIPFHAAELVDGEKGIVYPNTFLLEEYGKPIFDEYSKCNK